MWALLLLGPGLFWQIGSPGGVAPTEGGAPPEYTGGALRMHLELGPDISSDQASGSRCPSAV